MTRLKFPPLALAVLTSALFLGACVAGGSSSGSPSRFSNVVEMDEIETSTATNAYDLLQQVRPLWLRSRGSADLRGGAPVLPVVYVTGVRQGGLEVLRGISTLTVRSIRYVDATSATTRYGEGHSGGVIDLTLRRR